MKYIDLKEKKQTIHDELYKDHKMWKKKVKKPAQFNLNPNLGNFETNYFHKMVYRYFQNNKKGLSVQRFDPDSATAFFRERYSGGPDYEIDNPNNYLLLDKPSDDEEKENGTFFTALQNAAKTIQRAYRRHQRRKQLKSNLQKELRE